jgi:hypothetical protein
LPSAYDIIKSTIQAGSVYYYYERALKSSKQHNFIVININPSKDTIIFLVCASSQIDSTRRFRKNFPVETLVEITPIQYPGFSKKSIIDCNHIFPKNINEIARMLSRNKLQIKPVMGLRLVRQLRQGVILSPLVANEVKILLQTD